MKDKAGQSVCVQTLATVCAQTLPTVCTQTAAYIYSAGYYSEFT